ncbi:MAG: hypothetical protein U0704_15990 [Candidatus Eisenbacteria bacterium]
MPRRLLLALTACTLVLLATGSARRADATVPQLVQYQGFLTDLAGQPLDGAHDLEFALYTDSAAASPYWQEAHAGVEVSGGAFSVMLGTLSGLGTASFNGGLAWLETRVDGTPLVPRRPLASVPYALHSAQADVATALASGGPTFVHTPDPRPGCATVTPANGVLFSQTVTLSVPAALSTSAHIARLGVGRVDLNLYLDGVLMQSIATNTSAADWVTGVVQWSGAVGAGAHTFELRSTSGSQWGCGPNWGAIDTIVLK